jgi:PQQ-dependent dehydrogenase (methanol/ethanol family)
MQNKITLRAGFCFFISLLFSASALSNNTDWPSHGQDYKEQRFSQLAAINEENVSQLGLAWSFDTDFNRGLESTPIVVDGVMYVTGSWSFVYALDAKTGKLLWKYDPKVPKSWGPKGCCGVVNRGVAVKDGKVVVGTFDARLIALNAATGELLWETQTADIKKWPYTITGAPRIAKGKVFIGNGGAEYGVRGFVGAYDLETGAALWRFYTVPGNPAGGFESEALAKAADTWNGKWWERGGGGTVWDSIVYDEELDQLYIGTGNGTPWNRDQRSPGGGDNLYLNSIVALNPDTGDYIWHYQETPADNWDFTSTQQMILADMPWQGKTYKVIWHAPKNGFFFVIDRETGTPLSIEPYTKTTWATHYDKNTWRPVETPGANYQANPGTTISPSSLGAHNWHPMSYSPATGLVYIPVTNTASVYESMPTEFKWGHWNTGVQLPSPPMTGMPTLTKKVMPKIFHGHLLAWNPVTQKEQWRINHAVGANGGVLSTAGNLLFQGTSTAEIIAASATTGDVKWRYNTQVGVIAAPVSYAIDGEQYIAVAAGWGGATGLAVRFDGRNEIPPSRILVFKLGAKSTLPLGSNNFELVAIPPRTSASTAELNNGLSLYADHCMVCHGISGISSKSIPDLRNLPMFFYQNFNQVLLEGMMESAGMPSFNGVLTAQEVDNIYAYLIEEAHALREESEPSIFDPITNVLYDILANIIAWLET